MTEDGSRIEVRVWRLGDHIPEEPTYLVENIAEKFVRIDVFDSYGEVVDRLFA